MLSLFATALHLLINVVISYNLRRTCPAIPVKTRLPLQCETMVLQNQNADIQCDANGNYPYLLSCQGRPLTDSSEVLPLKRSNNTCQPDASQSGSAICCNQVIKDWNFEYNSNTCNDNYQLTYCYNYGFFEEGNISVCYKEGMSPTVQCHEVASNQELQCTAVQSSSSTNSISSSVPCPNNYTMTYCDDGIVLFNQNPTGLCTKEYDFAICCAIYKLETYTTFSSSKYLQVTNVTKPSEADSYCLSHFGTHAASIHSRHDYWQAVELCNNIGTLAICCLGAREVETGVWKWYDGSGTLPTHLKWDRNGLWAIGQPSNQVASENYTCLYMSDTAQDDGIYDCRNDRVQCYPLCNAINNNNDIIPDRRRLQLETNGLINTCFQTEITLDVENILADPAHILEETNNNAIKKVLEEMLIDSGIDEYNINVITTFNELHERRRMINEMLSIENECPFVEDNSINTFYFNSIPYNISCDNETLIVNNSGDYSLTLQWEFSTYDSIVYIWNIQKVTTLIKMCGLGFDMQANITNINGTFIGQSDVTEVMDLSHDDIGIQELTFPETLILHSNNTYFLNINIHSHDNAGDCSNQEWVLEQVELTPIILAIAEPSSCELGSVLAEDASMKFGLGSFCNEEASEIHRVSFEEMLYRGHSSDQVIAADKWDMLPSDRRRLGSCPPACRGPTSTNKSSLHAVYTNGMRVTIANDSVFPNYDQCIAVDDETLRVFSVGGEINGKAIDRLKVYQITSTTSAKLITDEIEFTDLRLDQPRYATMCLFYRNTYDNNKEYIIAINGMNNTNELNNNTNWYNDIVFIPLNKNERENRKFPKIELKYNVIDMRAVVTETNELYLFGGRNSNNAVNYIHVIDLNQVFNVSINDTLTTYDRMEHMQTNRIIPFVDFPTLHNESCIMIVGGQDYINGQYIDTIVPLVGLQLYCNQNLVAYLENTRRRLQNDDINDNNNEFTQFDKKNLQQTDNETILNGNNLTIVVNEYNFTNDNILYEFTVSFEICFNNGKYYKNALNLLNGIRNNSQKFATNILKESQKNYRDWSFGFGNVDVTDINIITFNQSIAPTNVPTNEPTNEPSVSPVIVTTVANIKPTNAPTDNPGPPTLSIILIVIGSVVGVIIIGVVIFLIIRRVKNDRNQFERLADTDDETEMEEL